MPIELVVNGYFRSGTTFVWSYLRKELKRRDYLTFYEPLNPDLALLIRGEEKERKKNRLHNEYLFEDYVSLQRDLLFRIVRDNPNANDIGILSTIHLREYLDHFHTLERKVFLQPNRLHFYLDLVFERYTRKVVHIIRHPLDVWLSIKRSSYSLVENRIKRYLYELFKPFKLKDVFEINKQYRWIIYHLGYPFNYRDSFRIRILNYYSAFDKFVVVWTLSNFYAIKLVEKYGGLIIPYEFILDSPREFKNLLSRFLEIDFVSYPNVKKGNYFKFDSSLRNRLFKVLSLYKIDSEFGFIVDFVRKAYNLAY